jgi:hypothetical protein
MTDQPFSLLFFSLLFLFIATQSQPQILFDDQANEEKEMLSHTPKEKEIEFGSCSEGVSVNRDLDQSEKSSYTRLLEVEPGGELNTKAEMEVFLYRDFPQGNFEEDFELEMDRYLKGWMDFEFEYPAEENYEEFEVEIEIEIEILIETEEGHVEVEVEVTVTVEEASTGSGIQEFEQGTQIEVEVSVEIEIDVEISAEPAFSEEMPEETEEEIEGPTRPNESTGGHDVHVINGEEIECETVLDCVWVTIPRIGQQKRCTEKLDCEKT